MGIEDLSDVLDKVNKACESLVYDQGYHVSLSYIMTTKTTGYQWEEVELGFRIAFEEKGYISEWIGSMFINSMDADDIEVEEIKQRIVEMTDKKPFDMYSAV